MASAVKRGKQTDKKQNQSKHNNKDDDIKVKLNKHQQLLQQQQQQKWQHSYVDEPWTPSLSTVFKVLMSARLSSAIWSNISDCDETFNYWEPVHYLIHGHGFQTWEYSPSYAIRSYAYLWLYTWPIKIYRSFFQGEKIIQFYLLRCLLAFVCAACETYFFKAVRGRFGGNVARLVLVILMFGAGMFISATAFLPSTFTIYTTLLSLAFWWDQKSSAPSIFFVALGSLLGWPFAAALGIPIAFDIVVNNKKLIKFIAWSFAALVVCMAFLVAIDSHYYGKLVIAPWNIVAYNVFSQHGPELYGVEPWSFYFINVFLNFNFAFLLAIISLPLLILSSYFKENKRDNKDWLCILGLYIWAAIFFTRPHKEERFLFPVYPIISLAAAISLDHIQQFMHYLISSTSKQSGPSKHHTSTTSLLTASFCTIFVILSISRIFALHTGYHAPMKIYANLNKEITERRLNRDVGTSRNRILNVCVGKEWYRFPSHFFLPEKCHLKFLKSEFKGQLPKEFLKGRNGTSVVPSNMNDLNLEEADRYVLPSTCDYLVDLDVGRSTKLEPNYSQQKDQWKVILTEKFLDASRSDVLARAFYIPFITPKNVRYNDYNVMVPVAKKKST